MLPLPVIIDSDPGIDDCLALLLALASPELEVRAVTTVYGNTTLANATRNAAEILARGGSALRPEPGADRPLARPLVTAAETHGASGLGGAPLPPAPAVEARPGALLHALERQGGPVVLLTLGPLTNLAVALATAPDLVRSRVSRHLAMAGNLSAAGNTTPVSEFNAWCDPEAAARVHAAGLPTEWVGLDVTRKMVLTTQEVESLGGAGRRGWLRDALRQYVAFHREYEGLDGCVVNDPLLVAELVRPGTLTTTEVPMDIVLADGDERGRTAVRAGAAPARFATAADAAGALRLLRERVFQ